VIYSWDDDNRDHIARHDVTPEEAEHVVEHCAPPYPEDLGEGKLCVWGKTTEGRWLQVIFVLKLQSEVAYDSVDLLDWAALGDRSDAKIVRVIHAMDLTEKMKRQLRRKRR
jgi:hypothetical protein